MYYQNILDDKCKSDDEQSNYDSDKTYTYSESDSEVESDYDSDKTKINSESEKSNYDSDRTDIKSDCEEEPNHSSDKLIELEEVEMPFNKFDCSQVLDLVDDYNYFELENNISNTPNDIISEINNEETIKLSLEESDADNYYNERSKSDSRKSGPIKIIRKSKSFSCSTDLSQKHLIKNKFMTSIDESITQILEGAPEQNCDFLEFSDSFDEIDFFSVDRSLISPATYNWIKDFRQSKTPEFRDTNASPYCEALNQDLLELTPKE